MNYTELLQTINQRPGVIGVVEHINKDGENQFYHIKRIEVFTESNQVASSAHYVLMINKETQVANWLNSIPPFMIDQPEPVPEVVEEPVLEEIIEEPVEE